MNPLLDIIDYRVVEISIKPTPAFDHKVPSNPSVNVSTDFFDSPNQPVSRLIMTIKHKKKDSVNPAYNITMVIEGLFGYQPDMEKDKLDQFLQLNAQSILFGLARGTVSQATSIMTNGKMLLPTMNFHNFRQRKSSKNKSK